MIVTRHAHIYSFHTSKFNFGEIFFSTAPIAVREVQKSDRSKKKLAKVAEADGEDEDGEDIDIKDEGEIGGDRCNVRCEGDGE
jgi:hypothetical protein